MTAEIFDHEPCELGEGPLWHPGRRQLFWFDILNKRLHTRGGGQGACWQFEEHVSAAGWVDNKRLLIASESCLFVWDITSGSTDQLTVLEADQPHTRSNDGRADPYGGFWIGTMGKRAQPGAGAIYRWFNGDLVCLYRDITIPNAICFSPQGEYAYFADTVKRQILRQPLDNQGWPTGQPTVFVDLSKAGLNPDGAVVDQQGCLWNAQWGASRVARYSPEGSFLQAFDFPARHTSCPAFGGRDLTTLFVTSAREGMRQPGEAEGLTYSTPSGFVGQAEHQVAVS